MHQDDPRGGTTGRPAHEGIDGAPGRRREIRPRVRVLTRGLAVAAVALLIGLDRLSRVSSECVLPATSCDGIGGYVQALTLSADGRMVYACTSDGCLTVWEPGSLPASMADGAAAGQRRLAASAPNARGLALAEGGNNVVFLDLSTGRREVQSASIGPTRALALSDDGATLATADGAGVRLLDVAGGRPLAWPAFDRDDVMSLAFSPDGKSLAVGCKDGMIHFLHAADGEGPTRPAFRADRRPVTSLRFTADGKVLASACRDGPEVRLWQAADGRPVAVLRSHACIQAIAFAPVGRVLAMAGRDGSVRVWDAANPASQSTVLPHDDPVTAVGFSSDGTVLATGTVGSIRLYRIDELARRLSRQPQ